MATYTVEAPDGKQITFEWSGDAPPTDQDMEAVFAASAPASTPTAEPDYANSNGRVDGVPEWGRDNPNAYAAVMTAADILPASASTLAKGWKVGVPLAGALNVGGQALKRYIGGEPQSMGQSALDFAEGAGFEGAGRATGATITGAARWLRDKGAEKLYSSAMKFSNSPDVLPLAKRKSIVETGLKYDLMPNEESFLRLKDLVAGNSGQVDDIIEQATLRGDSINTADVLRKGEIAKLLQYGKEVKPVNPGYLPTVKGKVQELVATPSITPAAANASKKQLQSELSDAFGQNTLSQPINQTKKQLAGGLRQALEDAYPEIKNLNAESSELLALSDHLARSIGRIENKDIIGLGDKIVLNMIANSGEAGLASKNTLWAATMALTLDNAKFKAALGRALYKANTGKSLPAGAWQKATAFAESKVKPYMRGAIEAAVFGNINDTAEE
jgi:hypothetical protein